MCGIIGMLDYKAGFFKKDEELFKELLIVNSLRGAHSTGIFGGKIEYPADYAKSVGNPYDFIENPATNPIWNKMIRKWRYVVGHGRQATRGKISPENAHPFQIEHITMVHNGTIWDSDKVDISKHDVDSKAIAHALTEHSPEEVFSDINGAYAIVWHNAQTKRLSLVRNKERLLAIGLDESNKRVMFASEKNMLNMVATRKDIKFKELFYIPEDVIFSFNKDTYEYEEIKVPKKKAKIYQIPFKEEPKKIATIGYAKEGKIIAITSKNSGERFNIDGEVVFSITEIAPFQTRGSLTRKAEDICHVFGFIEGAPEIEVAAMWRGKEESLYLYDTWSGKLKAINKASNELKKKHKEYSFYLSDMVQADTLRTYDGWILNKEEFKEMTQLGCDYCHSPIKLQDAANTLLTDQYVFCPKCSDKVFKEGIFSMKKVI